MARCSDRRRVFALGQRSLARTRARAFIVGKQFAPPQPIEAGRCFRYEAASDALAAAEKISRHSLMNRQLMSPAITELLFRASVILTR